MKIWKVIVHSISLVLIIGIIISAIGCVITGSSNIETRAMNYSDFTKLDVSNAFDVEVTQGDSYSVRITANDNLFKHLDIRREGRTLKIGLKTSRNYIQTTQKATIVMPDLDKLELSGGSTAELTSFRSQHSVAFELSGESSLYIVDFESGDTELDVSGESEISGEIKTGLCIFDISGDSKVELKGSATNISVDASGESMVRLPDFPAKDANIELSGESIAIIDVSGRLDADLSGDSELNYTGNPTLGEIDMTGGSKMNRR